MKINKTILVCIGLTFSLLLKSQAAISTSSPKLAMEAQFSQESLQAYQESSLSKIKDFYQYLEVLSDKTTSQELKDQIKQIVYSQFKNADIQVYNLIEAPESLITLHSLLALVEKNESVKFSIKNEISSQETYLDYWVNSYMLEIIQNNKTQTLSIKQKIYFTPQIKKFGENQKKVWNILLGEME